MEVAYLSQGIDVVQKHVVSVETELGVVVFQDMSRDATIISANKTSRDKLVEKVLSFYETFDGDDAVACAEKFSEWSQSTKIIEVETDGA